jgi:hypothetical protein
VKTNPKIVYQTMKNLFLFFVIILISIFSGSASAQEFRDVPENKSVIIDGVEYFYEITNESKVKEYNRFEVTISAKNVSGCQLIYINQNKILSFFEGDPSAIARFECINANGKRLTSKGGNLKARPFYVPYSRTEKTADGKTRTINENIQGGYIFPHGRTISNSFIVLTDEGRPKFKVRTQNFTDLTNTAN